MKLSNTKVQKIKVPGKYADGRGLILRRASGRREELGLPLLAQQQGTLAWFRFSVRPRHRRCP